MQKLITNTTNSPIYVMGKMIPPGEVGVVDEPGDAAPAEPDREPTLAELVATLLEGSVAKVTEQLATLSLDALDMATAQETAADKPRKGVLTALEDARLAAADAKLTSDTL